MAAWLPLRLTSAPNPPRLEFQSIPRGAEPPSPPWPRPLPSPACYKGRTRSAPPGEPVPRAAARTAVSRCVPVCSKPSDAFSCVQSEGQSPHRLQGPTPSAHVPHLPDLSSSHSLSAMLASSFTRTHTHAHTHTHPVASLLAVPSAWNALLQIPTQLPPSPPSDLYSNVTSSTRPKPTSPFQIPLPAPALPVPVIFLYLSTGLYTHTHTHTHTHTFFLALLCNMGSQFPNQGLNPQTLYRKLES